MSITIKRFLALFITVFMMVQILPSFSSFQTPTYASEKNTSASTMSALAVSSSVYETVYNKGTTINVTGWLKPDLENPSSEQYMDFKIEVYDNYCLIKTVSTDMTGKFQFTVKVNPGYFIKILKDGYLRREYRTSILGNYNIGAQDKPELMYPGDIPVKFLNEYTMKEEYKQDDKIDEADINEIVLSLNAKVGSPCYQDYKDINKDGIIDQTDINIMSKRLGYSCSDYLKKIALNSNSLANTLDAENTRLDLNGCYLGVDGNVNLRSVGNILRNEYEASELSFNRGTLYVKRDFNFGQPGYYDKLMMINEKDYLYVGGNINLATATDHDGLLKAGSIELEGDLHINEATNSKGFYATGSHKLILSKKIGTQSVILSNNPTSRIINTLVLTRQNTSDNYLLTPENCWNKVEVIEPVIGDLNGDKKIDSADYFLMRSYLLQIRTALPVPGWKIAGDLNQDSCIDSADLVILKRYLIGKITKLPLPTSIPEELTPTVKPTEKPTPTAKPTLTPTPTDVPNL